MRSCVPTREISWRQDLWTRTSRKPVAPFSTMAALGVFQGDICPLSSQSVPGVLCHPCPTLRMRELDFDTEPLCQKLESLQSELVKRMLKHLSNTAALTTLEVPTVRSRLLQGKLSFLHRVANSNPFSLSGRTVLALSQDIDSLCLVKECRELVQGFGTPLH